MPPPDNWPEGFDPESLEAFRAAIRLAFNVLSDAPFPAESLTATPPARTHLAHYRRWYDQQVRPLRELLFEMMQADEEPAAPPPVTLH
ncbi:MAG TPA: hypothetical protein VHQ90_00880 [Thermoanaerobaculia bacterium]|nr:hypothetical protein [Thermoanaerobaculia bacterium]